MSLNTCFNNEDLFKLTSEEFEALKQKGCFTSGFAPAKDYNISNNDYSRTILAYDSSISNFFFEEEANNDIQLFISNSFVVTFYPKTGKLEVITSIAEPLVQLLPAIADKIVIEKHIEKNKESLEAILFDPLIEKNAEILLTTGNLKDSITCCDCGYLGCSSEYVWAEKYYGLASFKIF